MRLFSRFYKKRIVQQYTLRTQLDRLCMCQLKSVGIALVEIAHLIFQAGVEEGFDEIVKRGLEHIVIIVVNRDDG